MFGKLHNEETLAKISAALKGENNPMCPEGFGKPKPEGSGKQPKKIEVLDLKTNQKKIYDSFSSAALDLGIKQSIISMYFRLNQTNAYQGRYVFSINKH